MPHGQASEAWPVDHTLLATDVLAKDAWQREEATVESADLEFMEGVLDVHGAQGQPDLVIVIAQIGVNCDLKPRLSLSGQQLNARMGYGSADCSTLHQ